MVNIMITGGTGFAGRHTAKRLAGEDNHIFILIRNKEKMKILGEEFLRKKNVALLFVKDPLSLSSSDYKKIIEKNNISIVMHFAALVGENWKIPWAEYYKVNVSWTEKLARGFVNANINPEKFLFVSTVGVYGTIPKRSPASEETGYNPDGKYHKSKVLAEKKLIELRSRKKLPLLILRPTTMYGTGDRGFLYKLFSLVRRKIFPLVDRNFKLHLLDVKTLAEVCSSVVWKEIPDHFILNVADKGPVDMYTLISYVKRRTGGGYLVLPASFFQAMINLLGGNNEYSIKLKLISQSRFYELQRLKEELKCNLGNTINNLENVKEYYTKAERKWKLFYGI